MQRLSALFFCAMFAVVLSAVPSYSADAPANSTKAIIAYYESSGSYAALIHFAPSLNEVATDTFWVDDQGNISGNAPKDALKAAQAKGLLTFATVSNFGKSDFSPHIAHLVLTNPKAR